jgi:hypothetical protein
MMHFAVYLTAYSDLGQPVTRWLVGGVTAATYYIAQAIVNDTFCRRPGQRMELTRVVDPQAKLWVDRNEIMKRDRDAEFERFMDEVILKGVPSYGN